jgi:uncharacterized protein DUF4154
MSATRPPTSPRRALLALGLAWLLFPGGEVAARSGGGSGEKAGESVGEYQLKAAFLGKFVKYVTWPVERAPRGAPLRVGVLGSDPFGASLDEIFRGRKVDDRPVEVHRCRTLESTQGLHLLFVPRSESERLGRIVETTRGTGMLLVGESPEFAPGGGVIGFYLEGEKLRFEINLGAARRENLRLSADLLKLARIVGEGK